MRPSELLPCRPASPRPADVRLRGDVAQGLTSASQGPFGNTPASAISRQSHPLSAHTRHDDQSCLQTRPAAQRKWRNVRLPFPHFAGTWTWGRALLDCEAGADGRGQRSDRRGLTAGLTSPGADRSVGEEARLL